MSVTSNTWATTHLSVGGTDTAFIDTGEPAAGDEQPPLLLLHGSGPGVSAAANWRPVLPRLSLRARVIAPDQLGFGETATGEDRTWGREAWTNHAVDLMGELGIETFDVIGNSMGGAIALSMAAERPASVRRVVLMGSMGVAMAMPPGLEAVWSYRPSVENMRKIIGLFAHDQDLTTDELVQLRYEASSRPAARDSWTAMFPEPRQRWVDDLALPGAELTQIHQPTLMVHGRDDRVVPWRESSGALLELLPDVRLHLIGNCGHWTMIEKTDEFLGVVEPFLAKV